MNTPDRQSQTEAPTKRRLEKARREGNIAKSSDLTSGVGLLVASTLLFLVGDVMGKDLLNIFRHGLTILPKTIEVNSANAILHVSATQFVRTIAIFVSAIVFTHFGVVLIQVGYNLSWEPLQPNWNRMNPVNGFSRLFSSQSVARGGLAVIKATALILLVAKSIQARMTNNILLSKATLEEMVLLGWDIVLRTSFSVSIALVIAGLIDYAYQKWQHTSRLRMTKQEVKDERKDEEGDPMLRARVKRVQRELSQGRMLKDVASATVVLTNPTHYAIALRYDPNSMHAPKVVAKGVDEVARRIRELAAEHDVPLLERRELARALYGTVDVGQEISPDLYHAIAEVVAYLHRIGRFRIAA